MHGRRAQSLLLPDNIACFQRRSASELNRPRHGRAWHNRFVLIFALRTGVTVSVDERALRLEAGQGLLVFPFQFHHYIDSERDDLSWLFITFELDEPDALQALRYRVFSMTTEVKAVAAELLECYQVGGDNDLLTLLLGLLLARLRRLDPVRPRASAVAATPGVVMQVNLLAQRTQESLRVRDLAGALGISPSHLRARFRASCGVSLGRHLRRLRLEKACGLLRLSANRVSEIAEQCGFTSIYSFSRAFRAAFGVSPMGYRRSGGARKPRVGGTAGVRARRQAESAAAGGGR